MTEIEEVAVAIQTKYPMLWPMTAYQASYIAQQEAGDQGDTIVNLLADALLKLNDDQERSNSSFNLNQLFGRSCKALGLAPSECSWFDVVGALEKLTKPPALEWKETFRADLFDALHACDQVLVYDEAYELIGEGESFYAVGDDVRIEVGTEEIDFSDQKVAIGPDGQCSVRSSTGRALFMGLNMARPFTSADLEAFKCKQQRATTEPQ